LSGAGDPVKGKGREKNGRSKEEVMEKGADFRNCRWISSSAALPIV